MQDAFVAAARYSIYLLYCSSVLSLLALLWMMLGTQCTCFTGDMQDAFVAAVGYSVYLLYWYKSTNTD